MNHLLDGEPRILDWGDPPGHSAWAPDGTHYSLRDDHVRGEGRRFWGFAVIRPNAYDYWKEMWPKPPGERGDEWDGSTDVQTVRNRAECHARRFHRQPQVSTARGR